MAHKAGYAKSTPIALEDSNIALLGSDLEKKVKAAAATKEHSWDNCGQKEGLEIWRIENFHVKPWPVKQYGSFYNGDSYIVLRTYKKANDKELSYDVHFWLGEFTSQDEAGTAAYKTVELDDKLGGKPVQYREVSHNETAQFLSYFQQYGGVRLMEGGVESGFHHVKPEEYVPRLFHIKTVHKHIVVHEAPRARASLNSADAFILDLGTKLIQWLGAKVNIHERQKALQLAQALENEREGKASIEVHREGDSDLQEFWKNLEGGEGPVKSAADGEAEDEKEGDFSKVLYLLTDSSGKLEFNKAAEGTVKRANFDTKDACIFDAGPIVFAWIGGKADANESAAALQYAHEYLKQNNRPLQTPIVRILEGGENDVFNSFLDK